MNCGKLMYWNYKNVKWLVLHSTAMSSDSVVVSLSSQSDTEMTRYMHDLRATYAMVRVLKSVCELLLCELLLCEHL